MKQIILSIRRIWTKAVFWFAYFFRIEYNTANTTLLVAIVPAMIALSRGITYLWQCFYYGFYFNIPVSLIQNTDSIWISFFRLVLFLCVLAAACGFVTGDYGKISDRVKADDSIPRSRTLRIFVICNWVVAGMVFILMVIAKGLQSYSATIRYSPAIYQIVNTLLPYMLSWAVGGYIGAERKFSKKHTETPVKIYTFMLRMMFAFFLFVCVIVPPALKPYPITTNEAGKPAAIVYLTNETAVLEEVEFEQDEKGHLTLIIHKNNQEIAASVTALTYEYQTFDHVKVVSDLIEHDNVKQDTIVNTYYMIMRYLVASHNQEQLNFSLAPYEMPPRP